MKKFFLLCSIFLLLFFTGCGKTTEKDAINKLENKINNAKSYLLTGKLTILNNEDLYTYNVNATYKKENNYKVRLVNQSNNHEQIILRNSDGVYVLTPSLNKSFKFQSDWPNNSSESYLLQPLLSDLKKSEYTIKEENGNYIYTTGVNYPNNSKLSKQDIILDKDGNMKSVIVYDSSNVKQIEMQYESISFNENIDNNVFSLDSVMSSCTDCQTTETTSSIDDAIFPLYLPSGTKLVSQEVINTDKGERVILTFDGEASFVLVEENSSVYEELEIIPISGEPYLLTDSYGALNDSSITWTMAGIDYYLTSNALSQSELIEVARSISVIPTMK